MWLGLIERTLITVCYVPAFIESLPLHSQTRMVCHDKSLHDVWRNEMLGFKIFEAVGLKNLVG